MNASIETFTLNNVEVQANGIIRNEKGRLIARLVDDVDFEGEHIKGIYKKEYPKNELFDKLADIEHQRWASWQSHVHNNKLRYCEMKELDGKRVAYYMLSADDYERWERQIASSFAELTEDERDKDRDQVLRYWPLLEEIIEKAWMYDSLNK